MQNRRHEEEITAYEHSVDFWCLGKTEQHTILLATQRLLNVTLGPPRDIPSDFSPPYIGSKRSQESPAAHPSPSTRSYLLSSQQSSPPVHVILRFDHVHHLIGVQFEFTLQLVQALHVLHGLLTVSLLPFLLLLLPTTLTLTDPPQIPANQRIPLGISAHPLGLLGWK